MKGEIEVRSKIGEGSTFFLKLPGLVCKKEDGRENDGKERHGQENLNGSKK